MIDLNRIRKLYNVGKELSLKDAKELIKSSNIQTFEKGELLIEASSSKNHIYMIIKGLVRCYHVNDKGEEVTFMLIPEYHPVVNMDMILYNEKSRFYFEALEKTTCFYNDFDAVDKIASENPKLESNRKFMFRRIMKQVMKRLESFVLLTPEERYLQYTRDFPNLSNRVPDKYIANVLGITPVSLSRIRKRISTK